MAAPYEPYSYSAAKTNDFDAYPHHSYAGNEQHIPEDEGFNHLSIPERSMAYDDVPVNRYNDEEQGYPMHQHAPDNVKPLGEPDDSRTSLVHNAADVGGRSYQDLGALFWSNAREYVVLISIQTIQIRIMLNVQSLWQRRRPPWHSFWE
jgi:hypothetical protein